MNKTQVWLLLIFLSLIFAAGSGHAVWSAVLGVVLGFCIGDWAIADLITKTREKERIVETMRKETLELLDDIQRREGLLKARKQDLLDAVDYYEGKYGKRA